MEFIGDCEVHNRNSKYNIEYNSNKLHSGGFNGHSSVSVYHSNSNKQNLTMCLKILTE